MYAMVSSIPRLRADLPQFLGDIGQPLHVEVCLRV